MWSALIILKLSYFRKNNCKKLKFYKFVVRGIKHLISESQITNPCFMEMQVAIIHKERLHLENSIKILINLINFSIHYKSLPNFTCFESNPCKLFSICAKENAYIILIKSLYINPKHGSRKGFFSNKRDTTYVIWLQNKTVLHKHEMEWDHFLCSSLKLSRLLIFF